MYQEIHDMHMYMYMYRGITHEGRYNVHVHVNVIYMYMYMYMYICLSYSSHHSTTYINSSFGRKHKVDETVPQLHIACTS